MPNPSNLVKVISKDELEVAKQFKTLFNSYDGLKGLDSSNFIKEKANAKYIQFNNIHRNEFTSEKFGDVVLKDFEKQNKVLKNDILITMSSENISEIGTTALNTSVLNNLYLNSFSKILRTKTNDDPLYLSYLLKSSSVRKLVEKEGQGITRINLSYNRLKKKF